MARIIKFPDRQQPRLPIEAVQHNMLRDFVRGVGMRSVAKMYQSRVIVIEQVLRERLRALDTYRRAA